MLECSVYAFTYIDIYYRYLFKHTEVDAIWGM